MGGNALEQSNYLAYPVQEPFSSPQQEVFLMNIVLKDTVFCVTGNFDNFQNTRTVESKLRAKGGSITKSMAQKTQVLVFGSGYTRKTEIAEERGMPIIRESELITLLETGEVEIDFSPPSVDIGEEELDALSAEARALLSQTPGTALWDKLVELIDRCPLETSESLIAYLEGHLAQWSRREQLLCLAPPTWLTHMTQGQDMPALRLVRRLSFDKLQFKSTAIKKALSCPNLKNVRYLDLSVEKKLTKTVFRALANDEKFTSIEHLGLGYFDEDCVKELDAGLRWDALKTLRFYPSDYYGVTSNAYKALFTSKLCANVEKVVLTSRHSWGSGSADILAMINEPTCLPALHHLGIDFLHYERTTHNPIYPWSLEVTTSRLPLEVSQRIDTFTLSAFVTGYYSGEDEVFDFSNLPQLKTLRLYTLPRHDDREDFLSCIDKVLHVDKMKFPDTLERIVTNVPLTYGAFARLKEARPELEYTYDPFPQPINIP
ncbi:MAG: hypothetical protein CL920_02090 [Deltaproteobacteria bacterium]|nr:hypothetical protein [Deltaproteobacteria bacterium]